MRPPNRPDRRPVPPTLWRTSPLSSSVTQTVHVALGPRSYEIVILSEGPARLPAVVERWQRERAETATATVSRRAFVVSDAHVWQPHGEAVLSVLEEAGWECGRFVMEPGESSKSLAVAAEMYDALVDMSADRQTIVIAVGGGVVGDAAGFVAATYARGLPFVQVPTSLLADVDSSVGGKVAVNHPRAKNMIGAFHQPIGVYIDTTMLQTLPEREFRSGLAEVVKYGVILDPQFFAQLEETAELLLRREEATLRQTIARCCRLKADVVEQDECEQTGLRQILNYGHTFAHAFEALSGYGRLLHGEAVAIGMVCASRLAERKKLIDAEVTQRQVALLERLGLPTRLPADLSFSVQDVIDRMRVDKKSVGGQFRFVLPTSLGSVRTFADICEDELRELLSEQLPACR